MISVFLLFLPHCPRTLSYNMETLEQFCGPSVSRNITLHFPCIVERLSGCSITLLFLARVLLFAQFISPLVAVGAYVTPRPKRLRGRLRSLLETFPQLLTTPLHHP